MTTEKTILLVDDDPNIIQVAGFAVAKAGYRVVTASDGKRALELVREEDPALVVLDIVMPEKDGIEVCRELRRESAVPVIFLSSMDDDIDRIVGLELGADDYLTKPFSPRELVARIRAVLRRTEALTGFTAGPLPVRQLSHGGVRLDQDCFRAFWQEREVALTATEFGIMKTLLSYPGKVFSRDELMARMGEAGVIVSDRTIDSHIRHIRDKFRAAGGAPIETVHGVGYKLATAPPGAAS
jgi:two-component system OmpR family response regulator